MNEYLLTDAVKSAKQLIAADAATCVVIKHGEIVARAHGRGIKPILEMYDSNTLYDSVVVDKVVGRAAALIMVAAHVRACCALTVSRAALEAFEKHAIPCEYTNAPDRIINRTGDGICPMEAAVMHIDEPKEAIAAVRLRLDQLTDKTEKK